MKIFLQCCTMVLIWTWFAPPNYAKHLQTFGNIWDIFVLSFQMAIIFGHCVYFDHANPSSFSWNWDFFNKPNHLIWMWLIVYISFWTFTTITSPNLIIIPKMIIEFGSHGVSPLEFQTFHTLCENVFHSITFMPHFGFAFDPIWKVTFRFHWS